jgi:hypothetical protein
LIAESSILSRRKLSETKGKPEKEKGNKKKKKKNQKEERRSSKKQNSGRTEIVLKLE